MARYDRTHFGDDMTNTGLAPRHLTREQFGRRVYKMMLAKGLHQAELARLADLPRNAISTYINGKSLPSPISLQKLAQVLDVTAEELLPNHVETAIEEDASPVELRVSGGDPSMGWLRVNRAVSMSTATKILDLLNNDTAFSDRG